MPASKSGPCRPRPDARRWRWQARRSRPDGGRQAWAAADRAGRHRPDRPDGRARHARSSAGRRRGAARAPVWPPARSPSAPASDCSAIAAGTPRLRIAAFSAAIFSSESPRNRDDPSISARSRWRAASRSRWWRRAARRARPRASVTSAGWRGTRNAAAVSISNTVIGSEPLARSHSSSTRSERLVADKPAAASAADPEPLVETHEVRRGVDVPAATGPSSSARMKATVEPAVGAGDMDDRRDFVSGWSSLSRMRHMRSSERSMRLGWSASSRAMIGS